MKINSGKFIILITSDITLQTNVTGSLIGNEHIGKLLGILQYG